MRHWIPGRLALVALSSLALVGTLRGQARQDSKSGLYRIEGVVTAIDKEKLVITVKQAGRANVTWRVQYSQGTAFTWRNEDAKLDDVKVGRQVICLGKIPDPEKEKTHISAVRVDVRR